MKEDKFYEKQKIRKSTIRFFIRAYRKNQASNANTKSRIQQIHYMQCYYEVLESLNELLLHHVGIIKIRPLLVTIYKSLNRVTFKSLALEDIDQMNKMVDLDWSSPQMLTDRADIFTKEVLDKLLESSKQLLKHSAVKEKIIHEIPFPSSG